MQLSHFFTATKTCPTYYIDNLIITIVLIVACHFYIKNEMTVERIHDNKRSHAASETGLNFY